MDNRKIDIQSEGLTAFKLAVKLLFDGAPGGKATHYVEDDGELILLWNEEKDAKELPYYLDAEEAAEFAWKWINKKGVRKDYLDHDGSNGEEGFRVYCGDWGRDKKYHYGFMRAVAVWAWYGK